MMPRTLTTKIFSGKVFFMKNNKKNLLPLVFSGCLIRLQIFTFLTLKYTMISFLQFKLYCLFLPKIDNEKLTMTFQQGCPNNARTAL